MKFKASGGGGSSIANLIKLKAGESVVGVLRGEPYEFEHAFKEGDKAKFRFRLNMVTKVNGAMTAMVLEGGWKLYQGLRTLSEAGWDLETSFVKISRQGSGMNDTTYTAAVIPQAPTSDALQQVAKIPLNDLTGGQKQPDPHHNQEQPADDLPF